MTEPLRVGVIADTHSLLRPEAVAALAGVDHLIHAGDVGHPEVLDLLRQIAPLTVVRGNNDRGEWGKALPAVEFVELAGRYVYVIHDIADLDLDPAAVGARTAPARSRAAHEPARRAPARPARRRSSRRSAAGSRRSRRPAGLGSPRSARWGVPPSVPRGRARRAGEASRLPSARAR